MESSVLSNLTRSLHAQRRFPGGETDGGFDGGRRLEEIIYGDDDRIIGIGGHSGVSMAGMYVHADR